MPDFLLRGIDNHVAEKIKTIARERNWALNDVILQLLKQALGMSDDVIGGGGSMDHQDIATLAGTWDPAESAAFRAALEAFEKLPEDDTPFVGQSVGRRQAG